MPVDYDGSVARLNGIVSAEEAERLLDWVLRTGPNAVVDLKECEHMHASVLQLLLRTRIRVIAWPRNPDLSIWLEGSLGVENDSGGEDGNGAQNSSCCG